MTDNSNYAKLDLFLGIKAVKAVFNSLSTYILRCDRQWNLDLSVFFDLPVVWLKQQNRGPIEDVSFSRLKTDIG